MKPFAYTAYTPEGREKTGLILAEDEGAASAKVQALGLLPAEIRAQSATPGRSNGAGRRLNPDMLAVFTRQIAVLLDAGLSVDAALEAVQSSAAAARLAQVSAQTRAALAQGDSLADALTAAGGALPPWYAAAVRAGEQTGDLDAVFETLATTLETRAGERAAITSALVYPAFVTIVAITVCAILMTTVAPEIIGMFEASGQPLPALTVTVMAIVDFIRAHWLALLLGVLALAALIVVINRTPTLRARRDAVLLRVPLVGRFMRMGTAAQYLRTLSVVINSRLPATQALQHAAGVIQIAAFRAQAQQAATALTRGDSVARALAGVSFLHPVARQLVQAGEASARLGPMTDRAAVLAESWLATERKRLSTIIEPLSMVIVGAAVLVVVMAILLPIFDMQTLVG